MYIPIHYYNMWGCGRQLVSTNVSDSSWHWLYCVYLSTLGKCYVVSSQKSLVQCMENLTQKLHPGVVVSFQKIGGASPTPPPDVVPMEINGECSCTTSYSKFICLFSMWAPFILIATASSLLQIPKCRLAGKIAVDVKKYYDVTCKIFTSSSH